MRLGNISPRINGQGIGVVTTVRGMIDTVDVASIQDYLQKIVDQWKNTAWGWQSPDTCYASLYNEGVKRCSLYPDLCLPNLDALVSQMCADYKAWYDPAVLAFWQRADAGGGYGVDSYAPPRPAGYVPPTTFTSGPGYAVQQAGGTPQQAYQAVLNEGSQVNALNTVSPQSTVVTPVQNQNVLNPPTQSASIQQTVTSTGTSNLTNDKATDQTLDVTNFLKDNWVLIAAGAAALVLLPGIVGGRR